MKIIEKYSVVGSCKIFFWSNILRILNDMLDHKVNLLLRAYMFRWFLWSLLFLLITLFNISQMILSTVIKDYCQNIMLFVISFSNLWHLLIIMSLRILKMFDQKNILHDPKDQRNHLNMYALNNRLTLWSNQSWGVSFRSGMDSQWGWGCMV
jgi:hypothetical protein